LIDDSCCVEKEFANTEKTLSDAAEDGFISNTDLNALDQQGSSGS